MSGAGGFPAKIKTSDLALTPYIREVSMRFLSLLMCSLFAFGAMATPAFADDVKAAKEEVKEAKAKLKEAKKEARKEKRADRKEKRDAVKKAKKEKRQAVKEARQEGKKKVKAAKGK